MKLNQEIATHFRAVFFGGNWTAVDLKKLVSDLDWKEANVNIMESHSIATIMYHVGYSVKDGLAIMRDEDLKRNPDSSFEHPPIESQGDWEALLKDVWEDAESFASLVEELPKDQLKEVFGEEKRGSYYYNLHGMIEHTHYHVGQISMLKKMIRK